MGGKTEGKDCFPLCQRGVGTRVVPTSITTTATLICCHPNPTPSARLACGSVADGLSITGGWCWCLGATLLHLGWRHIISHNMFTILLHKHTTHVDVTKASDSLFTKIQGPPTANCTVCRAHVINAVGEFPLLCLRDENLS